MIKYLLALCLFACPAYAETGCDVTQPHTDVDGVCTNLTAAQITTLQATQAAEATAQAAQQLIAQAQAALTESDKTMLRIEEAVALGTNSWTNADVVAWVTYRRNLRAIVKGGAGPIPQVPPYPAGT